VAPFKSHDYEREGCALVSLAVCMTGDSVINLSCRRLLYLLIYLRNICGLHPVSAGVLLARAGPEQNRDRVEGDTVGISFYPL
jgi:hypothetical protein